MKKIFTWVVLFQKRILKKPMFQITLVLIPALMLLLFAFNKTDDSLIKVAICAQEDEYSKRFMQDLIDSSDSVVSFYKCKNEEQLRNDVIKGRAECGYIFPQNFKQQLSEYQKGNKNKIITGINKESSLSSKIVNEIIYGKVFSEISYMVLEDFITEKQPDYILAAGENEKMQRFFSENRQIQLMFSYEYAQGEENELLNSDNGNYYMMPVRGILSVLIMVSAMSGILMLSIDEKNGVWQLIKLSKRPVFNYFYVLMTVLPVSVISLGAIFFTQVSTNIFTEIMLMFLYVLLITGFCNLLKVLIRNVYILCALIPVWVLLSLILCAVFVDVGNVVPGIKVIRLFLPTSYYLDAIYSSFMQIKMCVAAVVVSVCGIAADKCSRLRI